MKLTHTMFAVASILASTSLIAVDDSQPPTRDAVTVCRCSGQGLYAKVIRISDGKVLNDELIQSFQLSYDSGRNGCINMLTSAIVCKN